MCVYYAHRRNELASTLKQPASVKPDDGRHWLLGARGRIDIERDVDLLALVPLFALVCERDWLWLLR